jgi:poly-beta-1,6-N-acetyl-D-glucosamine synthase
MALVFWTCLALLAFAFVGYPLWMATLARLRPRPLRASPGMPTVQVLLVAHNAQAQIVRKLENLLALDYPPDRLRIAVALDGCNDATEALVDAIGSPRIDVFAFAQRRGKSACIGDVLPRLDAEIVLFTDVRQRVDARAVRMLVGALSDPAVGAASGELMLEPGDGYARGIEAYWRMEKWIRRNESASGSIVGATGALYAARRTAIDAVPAGLVLDDMWIPLRIAAAGYRIVFVPGALAFDQASSDPGTEQARKRRTLAGNYQLLRRWPALAIPGAHPLALRLWGHKWLRLLAPWLLLALLASNLVLAFDGDRFYLATLCAQSGLYVLALLARLLPRSLGHWLPARLCHAFVGLNFSALLALGDFLRKPHAHLWSTTRAREAAR